jgi:hypothetical protein
MYVRESRMTVYRRGGGGEEEGRKREERGTMRERNVKGKENTR